jgi:hypothetical protein
MSGFGFCLKNNLILPELELDRMIGVIGLNRIEFDVY